MSNALQSVHRAEQRWLQAEGGVHALQLRDIMNSFEAQPHAACLSECNMNRSYNLLLGVILNLGQGSVAWMRLEM